jgi:hypothetical protein
MTCCSFPSDFPTQNTGACWKPLHAAVYHRMNGSSDTEVPPQTNVSAIYQALKPHWRALDLKLFESLSTLTYNRPETNTIKQLQLLRNFGPY